MSSHLSAVKKLRIKSKPSMNQQLLKLLKIQTNPHKRVISDTLVKSSKNDLKIPKKAKLSVKSSSKSRQPKIKHIKKSLSVPQIPPSPIVFNTIIQESPNETIQQLFNSLIKNRLNHFQS